jgi:hypothetical protein
MSGSSKFFFKWRSIFIVVFILNLLFFCFQFFQKKTVKADNTSPLLTVKMQTDIDSVIGKNKDNMIVLRLLKHDCKECIDSLFNNTIRLAKIFGKGKVAVLMSGGYEFDEFLTYKRVYQYDLNVYQVTTPVTSYDQSIDSYYFHKTAGDAGLARRLFLVRSLKDAGYSDGYNKWFDIVFKYIIK